MLSLRQIAERQNVSYEAIRKQVVRYEEELKGHISVKNRTQYLDEWAVKFLQDRRRESPVVIVNQEKEEELKDLKDQVETLRTQLLTAQKELLKSQEERLKAQDQIILLQEESRKTLEARIKYTALLEENKAKEAELTVAKSRIEDLQKERDEAQTEAQSFKRSLFGFYRKR